MTASLEKLAAVIKIIGVLLQMKVYLLWIRDNSINQDIADN
jgi:hypothetical protein